MSEEYIYQVFIAGEELGELWSYLLPLIPEFWGKKKIFILTDNDFRFMKKWQDHCKSESIGHELVNMQTHVVDEGGSDCL